MVGSFPSFLHSSSTATAATNSPYSHPLPPSLYSKPHVQLPPFPAVLQPTLTVTHSTAASTPRPPVLHLVSPVHAGMVGSFPPFLHSSSTATAATNSPYSLPLPPSLYSKPHVQLPPFPAVLPPAVTHSTAASTSPPTIMKIMGKKLSVTESSSCYNIVSLKCLVCIICYLCVIVFSMLGAQVITGIMQCRIVFAGGWEE